MPWNDRPIAAWRAVGSEGLRGDRRDGYPQAQTQALLRVAATPRLSQRMSVYYASPS
jgi:hypothetical protein